MRSALSASLLLALAASLPGLVALAPPAAARPCMEDASCCHGVTLPDGACVETPCGDAFWPPCQASPASASRATGPPSLARCFTLVDEPALGEQACADVDDRGCIVWLEHRTALGAEAFCLVPQPPPL